MQNEIKKDGCGELKKDGRGGRREGAGRKRMKAEERNKTVTISLPPDVVELLNGVEGKSRLIADLLRRELANIG